MINFHKLNSSAHRMPMIQSPKPFVPAAIGRSVLASLLLVNLLACSAMTAAWKIPGSTIVAHQPLLDENNSQPSATVYLIRPNTERWMGAADNVLTIEADKQMLAKLVKGEYLRTTLYARDVTLTIRSLTAWGPDYQFKMMEKSQRFHLEAGKTYFIVAHMVDGEFRGVYFKPQEVALSQARQLARRLRAVGSDAKAHPIESL